MFSVITSFVAGIPTFRLLSPIMAYSVCMYLFKVLTVYNTLRTNLLPRFVRTDDFVTIVITWVSFIGVLIYIFSPIFMWLDSRKFILHMKKWLQFQVPLHIIENYISRLFDIVIRNKILHWTSFYSSLNVQLTLSVLSYGPAPWTVE
jgi:hypothetical protein